MSNDERSNERNHLLSIKDIIEPELMRLEQLILFHSTQDSDQEFAEYRNKAIYYRDILERINRDLADLDKPF